MSGQGQKIQRALLDGNDDTDPRLGPGQLVAQQTAHRRQAL